MPSRFKDQHNPLSSSSSHLSHSVTNSNVASFSASLQTPKPTPTRIPARVFCAFIASGLLSLCGVVVETATNIAFPTLMREFHIGTDTVQWMTTIYLLVASVVVPLSANLKARFTSRSLFITANLCFLIGLLVCIFAPVFPLLLAGRALQGLGAGIALPLMFNIILEEVPRERIGVMMGCGTLITAVAPAIGPTFGGVVVSSMSWRFIFVFLVPVVVLSLVMGALAIRQGSELRKVRFDILSIVLIAVTFAGLIIGLNAVSSSPFLSLNVAGALALGVVALVLFVIRQLHLAEPMLDVRVLRNLRFSGFVIAYFLFQAATLGMSLILPNYMQLVDGSSALVSGLCLMPGALLGAVFAPLGGRILDVFGPKPPLVVGPALTIISMVLFLVFGHSLSAVAILGLYLLFMLGTGLCMGNMMTTGLTHLKQSEQSMGNAFFNTAQQFAGAVGTALGATLLAIGQRGTSSLTAGTMHGAVLAFAVLLAVLVVHYVDLMRALF